jgi:hypothetical protein
MRSTYHNRNGRGIVSIVAISSLETESRYTQSRLNLKEAALFVLFSLLSADRSGRYDEGAEVLGKRPKVNNFTAGQLDFQVPTR